MARIQYEKVTPVEFDRLMAGGYISETKIAGMSYNQLTRLVDAGRVSAKELRSAYSSLRKTAKSRERNVSKESVVQQFGNTEKENFRTSKNLVTTSELLHELADVGKYLRGKRSTVSGLKEQRRGVIEQMEAQGFDIDEENYPDFIKFMRWFKASEYSKLYDSDSEEVSEVFNSGSTTPRDWKKLFKEISGRESAAPAVRQY